MIACVVVVLCCSIFTFDMCWFSSVRLYDVLVSSLCALAFILSILRGFSSLRLMFVFWLLTCWRSFFIGFLWVLLLSTLVALFISLMLPLLCMNWRYMVSSMMCVGGSLSSLARLDTYYKWIFAFVRLSPFVCALLWLILCLSQVIIYLSGSDFSTLTHLNSAKSLPLLDSSWVNGSFCRLFWRLFTLIFYALKHIGSHALSQCVCNTFLSVFLLELTRVRFIHLVVTVLLLPFLFVLLVFCPSYPTIRCFVYPH